MGVVGIDDQRRALAEWLWSEEGRDRVRSQLRRRRLPTDDEAVGSVANGVALRVLRRLERGPILDEDGASAVVRYAQRCIANAANDGWRARRRDLELLIEDLDPPTGADPVGEDAVAALSPLADELRDGVHATVRPTAVWRPAAALTVITVSSAGLDALDPTLMGPGPQNGSFGPYWTGLRLAGRDDCFAQPDTNEVRNRRARAISSVRDLLARLAGEALGVSPR